MSLNLNLGILAQNNQKRLAQNYENKKNKYILDKLWGGAEKRKEMEMDIAINVRNYQDRIGEYDPRDLDKDDIDEMYLREAEAYDEREKMRQQQLIEDAQRNNIYEDEFGENLLGDKIKKNQSFEFDEAEYEDFVRRDVFWRDQAIQQSHQWVPEKQDPNQLYYNQIREMQLASNINNIQAQFQDREIIDDQRRIVTGKFSEAEHVQTIEQKFAVNQKSVDMKNLNPRMKQFFSNLASLQNAKNKLI